VVVKMQEIKYNEKLLLTVKEACIYSGIGENKLRELLNSPNCSFLLINGNKKLVKRSKFETWLNSCEII